MRFVTFEHVGVTRAGMLSRDGARVLDLGHLAVAAARGDTPADVMEFVEAGLADIAARIAAKIAATDLPAEAWLLLTEVKLHAPLRPHRIFAAAYNYRRAIAERGLPLPAEPVMFLKETRTVIAPGEPVVLPPEAGGITYEAELAVIIGRPASGLDAGHALEHVAGYTIFNDVTATECVRADGNFRRGKNFATFGPLGPFLASADDIADPERLEVTLHVDGLERQRGSTDDMLFGVAELIARVSRLHDLRPGDMIATGTPAGVAIAHIPPAWLKRGTVMRAHVEGLGVLENPVI
ncbi:fumarylacetoacetate hydrolase family protein [Ancylobacter sp. A5.8]|uniref:fumarylacetoacetate hydrolase family protein n=1 Tax=Ancylobacter gelatini TaxID=2919920 RepID=UPI001F4DFD86|nr:fumarylacetoacetate hydrolase family protein [Ancylobacter gelatini]MCJ8144030.1 fumarylacetoacetate hydrolase family protein [Ancylobacter gelatini]